MTDDSPDLRILWQRQQTARIRHVCESCKEVIEPGARYESVGLTEDGSFYCHHYHGHMGAYPSYCPKFAERDKAEIAKQFAKDQAMWNTGVR